MNKDRHPGRTGRTRSTPGADDRAARQAAALRENLARRKAQARSRAGMAGGEDGEDGEEFSMEDLQAALEALVAEGTLQPEEAQQLIASLTGEGFGEAAPAEEGGDAGGEAAPAEGGEVAPAAEGDAGGEAAPAEEGEKEASATSLLAAIRQLRAARAK